MSRAEVTRHRILDECAGLLTSRPGALPSMSEIAGAAGVTRQLLYVHFDNRTALLVELSRMMDREVRTPELQATIDDAPDGRAALRAAVRVQAAIKPALHGVASALERLRPVDEGAAAACREREDARLARCRVVVDRLDGDGLLAEGWTASAAADLLWSMTSMQAWEGLVHRAGWSVEDWTRHTTRALEATLLVADGHARPASSGSRRSRGGRTRTSGSR